jgi:hypothetical protein
MGEKVEKVTLPFAEVDENASGSTVGTGGALALAPVDTASANAAAQAARLAEYARSWGITSGNSGS